MDLQHTLELHAKWLRSGMAEGRRANLSGADLTGAKLTGAKLTGAKLTGADLTGAKLTGAKLTGADLTGADLTGAGLSGVTLTGAEGLPEIEAFDIDTAIAEAVERDGALSMDHWHSECGTTHCRAGWACVLHPQGPALEDLHGTSAAAALIYNACSSLTTVPDWHVSNSEALEDIRKAAGQ